MSGEFRWVDPAYFHSSLGQAADCPGDSAQHEVSQIMSDLYRALQPIEAGCAWFEAGDSGPAAPTIAVLKNIDRVKAIVGRLENHARYAQDLVDGVIRSRDG